MLVETLSAGAQEVAPAWAERRRQVDGADTALFRIVRDIGGSWDATGDRETVAVYRQASGVDAASLPDWPDPAPRPAGTRTAWRELYADPAARPYQEVDRFIFMIEVSVDPAVREDFDHWYTSRHVPDVRPAGLVAARRYESLDADAVFLTTYEMDSPSVLSSDALARVRGFDEFAQHVVAVDRVVLHPAAQS